MFELSGNQGKLHMEKLLKRPYSRTMFCCFFLLVGVFTFMWIISTDLSFSGSVLLHRVPLFELNFENKFTARNDSFNDYSEESSETQGTEAPSETIDNGKDKPPDTLLLDNKESGLSIEQKLRLANMFGPDANYHVDFVSIEELVKLTIQRLTFRILRRLSQVGTHLARVNETNSLYNETLYLTTLMYEGGLGNFLFVTASSWGLAQTNQRTLSFLETYEMERDFLNLGIPHINVSVLTGTYNATEADQNIRSNYTLYESQPLTFQPDMTTINRIYGNRTAALGGYLQSWKYFDQYRSDIRALLTFSRNVYMQAYRKIKTRISGHYNRSSSNSTNHAEGFKFNLPTLVGIHVRRGDITDPGQHEHGHQVASEAYLLRVPLRLQAEHRDILFLVVSNDMEYCRKLYEGLDNYVFMTPMNDREPAAVDMAVLSLMDHLVLTVGSFGWWSAYLSDARDVYYFKDWPREGSTMKNGSRAADYFLPHWKPFI